MTNTFDIYFRNKYSGMVSRCKGQNPNCKERYGGLPFMDRDEWTGFVEKSKPILLPMFNKWKRNGHSRKLCPSIDRIDVKKGYVAGNVRWITHSTNSMLSRRNETTCKQGHLWAAGNIYLSPSGDRECLKCKRQKRKLYYEITKH